jgi:methyl-accepting chemotaxis protein
MNTHGSLESEKRGASLSIKVKVGLTAVLCMSGAGVAMLTQSQSAYRRNVTLVTEQALVTARSTFSNLETADIDKLDVALELIMANPALMEAFAARDRPKLLELSLPILDRLKTRYGITNFNYMDDQEVRFLITQEPDNPKLMGTKAVRFNIQEAARTKTWSAGLGLGFSNFAIRTAHPVWDTGKLAGNKLIGYLELGSDIGRFIQTMKKLTTSEYGLLIRKQFLKEEMWRDQRQKNGLRDNWADQTDLVLGTNTWTDETIFAFPGDVTALPDEGRTLDEVQKDGLTFARSVFPLKDASGAKVGGLFVLTNITRMHDELSQSNRRTVITTLVVIVLVCVSLLGLLSRLVFRRLAAITMVATRLVGGDYETPVAFSTEDEVGAFERLFEQLRIVFVNLLEEYEKLSKSQK